MKDKTTKALVVVMALGTFVVVIDNTIMNVSISYLVEDLNTSVSGIQAAISLNALMMAAFVLMGGKMADIIGMKKTFLLGAIFYISGSTLASFSNNLTVFILGWCTIQGFGAAMMLPNVTTIVRANTAGPVRAQAYAIMAAMNALGLALGPLVGGFLTTYFSWRWAFRLEVFILLIVLLMSKVIPKDVLGKVRPSLDKVGVIWQAGAMIFMILGTLLIADYGLFLAKQPFMIGGFAFAPFGLSIVPFLLGLGLLCLMQFVHWERKLDAKGGDVLVDLRLFNIKDFVTGLNVRFIQTALMAGTTFAVPLYLQVTYGLSAFETGFILLGLTAGLLLTNLTGTKIGTKYLPKQKVAWGFLLSILGIGIMIVYMLTGDTPKGLLPGLFVYGMGIGLIASQIVDLIMTTVSAKQTPEASGVTSTLETLGSSVGTALVGTVLVVSLTGGVGKMIDESIVFTPEDKQQISQDMATSIEVVSDEVISEELQGNGAYEEEAIRIYDQARQNAFIITLFFMAFSSLIGYMIARSLPATKNAASDTA